ncbi:MAG: carboxypeptidase-like regulatory domain-containing protein [Armatimonadota bacterium]|nr:carboxypeptidase-like regulatory domain-containing protein [Armatimonadota bacterium]
MKKFLVVLIAVFMLLASASVWAVKGRVVNQAGKPVPGAVIYASSGGGYYQMQTFTADDKGQFKYYVGSTDIIYRVADSSGKPLARAKVSMPVGPNRKHAIYTDKKGVFKYTPQAKPKESWVGIRVADVNGKPVPKAAIYVSTKNYPLRNKPIAVMDDKGEHAIEEPQARESQRISLIATAAGYTYTRANIPVEDESVTITLLPEKKLRGKVVNEKGAPVQQATVELGSIYGSLDVSGGMFGNSCVAKTTTGKDGSFVLNHMPNPADFEYGGFSIKVQKPGHAIVHESYQLKDIGKRIVVTDSREARIRGVLYLPGKTGTAPEGIPVGISINRRGSSETRYAQTDKNGAFSLGQLPAGVVSISLGPSSIEYGADGKPKTAEPRQFAFAPLAGVRLSAGQTKTVNMVATRGALIKGVLQDKITGKPISSIQLFVYNAGRPKGVPDTIWTNEKGEFALRIPAGDVRITLRTYTYAYSGDEDDRPEISFAVKDGEEKTDIAFSIDPAETRDFVYSLPDKTPDDFELKAGTYELTWDPDFICRDFVWDNYKFRNLKAKALITKLPKFVSERPFVFAFILDGNGKNRFLYIALDESKGSKKGYDTAYIDANLNGDMTDDQPVKFKIREYESNTSWVAVQEECDNSPMQVRICMIGNAEMVKLESKGAWVGFVESGKGKAQIALVDTNRNGIYCDPVVINDKCDWAAFGDNIFIDTTGAGRAIAVGGSPHSIRLFEVAELAGRFYTFKASPTGDKVTITPYQGPYGQLLVFGDNIQGLKGSVTDMIVMGKPGQYVFGNQNGAAITLPAGEYKVLRCALNLEAGSKKAPISCSLDSNVIVEADKQAAVTIGGKLSLAINPDEKEMILVPNSSKNLDWIIKIGNNVSLSSIGDRSQGSAPKVNFYDKTGKLISTATAGYT